MTTVETRSLVEQELLNIEEIVLSETGYKLNPAENREKEIADFIKLYNVINSKTKNNTILMTLFADSIIRYKKKRNLAVADHLTDKEQENFYRDLSFFLAKTYNEQEISPKMDDFQIEIERTLPNIVQLKELQYLNVKSIVTDTIDVRFVKSYRKELPKIAVKIFGKPSGKVSQSKQSKRQRNLFKRLMKIQVESLETHGFKVEQKRDLLKVLDNAEVMNMLSDIKKPEDLTSAKLHQINNELISYIIAKPVRFTKEEQKIISNSIAYNYNSFYDEYEFNLPFENVQYEILKRSKKVMDLRQIKTKENYKDLNYFKKSIDDTFNNIIKDLFEMYKPKQEMRLNNYEEVFEEVYSLIENVCEFNAKDEIAYKYIKDTVQKLEVSTLIDNIKYVDETMSVIITYNNNQGMFIVNPYVMIEVYNKRVYADKTGKISFTDSTRANKVTSGLANYLLNALKKIYFKRGHLNVITKPFTNEADYARINALHKVLTNEKTLVMQHKIKFKEGLDETQKINRIQVQINKRNLIISPAYIFDVDTKSFLFKRENPSSTLKELAESNFKPNYLMGINEETAKTLIALVKITFDLRKNI